MAYTFTIFYSWQSDTDDRYNRNFIEKCLKKAISELKRDDTIQVVPSIDKDTVGKSGSPDILEIIKSKIDSCDIFVADVSLINTSKLSLFCKHRNAPNPNVLFELGYASSRLSKARIICLNNGSFSEIDKLPFDIRNNRILSFKCDKKELAKENKYGLSSWLASEIKNIIQKYDNIIANENQGGEIIHDKKQFASFNEIISEKDFKLFLNSICVNRIVERNEFDILNSLQRFLNEVGNEFLNPDINAAGQVLLAELDNTLATLGSYSGLVSKKDVNPETQEITDYSYYSLKLDEERFRGDNQEFIQGSRKREDDIDLAVRNLLKEYVNFRRQIKKHLFV
ncbi:MAG: nucleotide-binding protein [Flavobacteriales bacterium]|nr:nucleotide-binding protein [Flavobacteriales bacterium]